MDRLANTCVNFVDLPAGVTPCSKGVRYFMPVEGIELLKGAMDTIKEGRQYKKRIVVRPSRHRKGLHELYTYHFPTHWSPGCEANRELMAEARRQAHAIERDYSRAGLEWRIRFIAHHFNPEPGIKRYKHIFHFAYAVIQQEMRAAAQTKPSEVSRGRPASEVSYMPTAEDVTFEPVCIPVHGFYAPVRHRHRRRKYCNKIINF